MIVIFYYYMYLSRKTNFNSINKDSKNKNYFATKIDWSSKVSLIYY